MFDFLFDGGEFSQRFTRIVLTIIVLLVINYIIRHFIGKMVEQVIQGHHYQTAREERLREETLTALFRTTGSVLLWVIGIIFILQEFGVNFAAIITGAGLVGIVVGIGAQSTIKNYLNGLSIVIENQFRVGDVVTLCGLSGTVEHITLRVTKLRDLDGSVYFVPNGEITTVKNMTLEYSGVVVQAAVGYDTDIAKVEQIMNEVGREQDEDAEWKDKIIEPITFLALDSFGDAGVIVKATGKTKPMEQWDVASDYRKRLKKAFEKHDIDMPLLHYEKPQAKKK